MNKRFEMEMEERKEKEAWNDAECMEFMDQCEEMLGDEDYDFASDTIEGIRSWVEKNNKVTIKQRNAIQNIKNSVDKSADDFDDFDNDIW